MEWNYFETSQPKMGALASHYIEYTEVYIGAWWIKIFKNLSKFWDIRGDRLADTPPSNPILLAVFSCFQLNLTQPTQTCGHHILLDGTFGAIFVLT